MQLPSDIDPKHFDKSFRLCPDEWINAALELFTKHDLPTGNLKTFPDGSNLLAANQTHIVKIFPPFHLNQWESERRVLPHLQNYQLPIPELTAEGIREDGWPYVILTRLPGITLESCWPHLEHDDKKGFLHSIGQMMAKVHAVPVGKLSDLAPEWNDFLNKQRAGCRARHERYHLPKWLLNEVDTYIEKQFSLLPSEPPVILTGEYTPFNLLIENGEISGMIDFGDAMIGFREYDLLGPLLFLCGGDRELISALYDGYGYRPDANTSQRLMLLAILHRYSNFPFQIRIDDWVNRVQSISALERLLFIE